jgi:hypothetical protein
MDMRFERRDALLSSPKLTVTRRRDTLGLVAEVAAVRLARAGLAGCTAVILATTVAASRAVDIPRPQSADCTVQESWKRDFVAAEARDYGRTRLTERGLYRVSIKAPDDMPPVGKIHEWILHIEDTTGVAVDSATVCVDGGMPEHGHGMPTAPEPAAGSINGDYRIEGMKFSMTGWWVVKFVIQSRAGTDSVRFNLGLH